jgi:hypothetical protein
MNSISHSHSTLFPKVRYFLFSAFAIFLVGSVSGQMAHYDWTKGDWKGDDRKYLAEQERISKLAAAQIKTELNFMYRAHKKVPVTNIKIFKFMCLELAYKKLGHSVTEDTDSKAGRGYIYGAMNKHYDANSYVFTRVCFIHTTRFDMAHISLIPLSERLLKRDPNDWEVLNGSLKIYEPQGYKGHREIGEKLVKRIDDLNRATPSSEFNIGYFYFLCWQDSNQTSDKTRSRKRFERAIELCTTEKSKQVIRDFIKRELD